MSLTVGIIIIAVIIIAGYVVTHFAIKGMNVTINSATNAYRKAQEEKNPPKREYLADRFKGQLPPPYQPPKQVNTQAQTVSQEQDSSAAQADAASQTSAALEAASCAAPQPAVSEMQIFAENQSVNEELSTKDDYSDNSPVKATINEKGLLVCPVCGKAQRRDRKYCLQCKQNFIV